MYDFLARNIDSQRFDELLNIISKGKCIAFVGAGLSRPLGYRVWDEGIIESSSPEPTLIKLAGITKEDALKKPLPEIIDNCKEILGEKYFEFLQNEFGINKKTKRHLNLNLLWNSNYQHYVTTNFDVSLYNNREDCKKLVTYPSKDLVLQNERTLYHIHSRAYITKGENDVTLRYYLERLVYGKQSYIDAYDPTLSDGAISSFVYSIIQSYTLLFVGFSMRDEDFKNTYKQMKLRWERYLQKINKHPLRKKEEIMRHYILLPYPQKNEYENEKEFIKQKEEFEYNERQLSDINVFVISYKKMDLIEHKGLTISLEYIMERAPLRNKTELFEVGIELFDSSSASTREVKDEIL